MSKVAWVVSLLAWSASLQAQTPLEQVEERVELAKRHVRHFHRDGGRAADPANPAHEWAARLIELRERFPQSEAAGVATVEALRLLLHAAAASQVLDRAEALAVGDVAWRYGLVEVFSQAATEAEEPGRFVSKGESVLAELRYPVPRMRLLAALGEAYRQAGELERARESYRQVIELGADADLATAARGHLLELEKLQPGQPAPAIEATALDGSRFSLAANKGHPTLIIFWASW